MKLPGEAETQASSFLQKWLGGGVGKVGVNSRGRLFYTTSPPLKLYD